MQSNSRMTLRLLLSRNPHKRRSGGWSRRKESSIQNKSGCKERKLEAIVECDMFEAVDLSKDIPWTITEVDDEEESNDMEQETKLKVEIPKVFSFHERMKRLSPH